MTIPESVKSASELAWQYRVPLALAVGLGLVGSVLLVRMTPILLYAVIGALCGGMVWQLAAWAERTLWPPVPELHPALQPIRDSMTHAFRSTLLSLVIPIGLLTIAAVVCSGGTDRSEFVEVAGACGDQDNPDAICGRFESAPTWHVYSEASETYREGSRVAYDNPTTWGIETWDADEFWKIAVIAAMVVIFIAGPIRTISRIREARGLLDHLASARDDND